MQNRSFIRMMVCTVMTMTCLSVSATRYTILSLNTRTVKVGSRILKVGDSFSDKDIHLIKWVSDRQAIKTRNEDTKATRVFTKRNVEGEETPSLKRYLTQRKGLMTRSISLSVELLDTVSFDISNMSTDNKMFISVWKDGDYRVRTSLPVSQDGKRLYLTRGIYGHHKPKKARIGILQYNLKTNSDPDTLGLLSIDLLPLMLP
ncbi:MAG: hypothetical protein IJ190_13200 [Prevotella sp.]|nr:hypothetical protein [Prevotella sp.]